MENSKNLILMSDFNCKEVNWQEWETEGSADSWGSTLLSMVTDNVMTQWVKEETTLRRDDTPARVDLLLTKEPDVTK